VLCRLINLRLSHSSDLDYFNDVFNNFSGPASFDTLEAYEVRPLSDLIKNFFFCVQRKKETHTDLKQLEGE